LIPELIQFRLINASLQTRAKREQRQFPGLPGRFVAQAQPRAKDFIDGLLEGLAVSGRRLLEPFGEVVIQGQRGPRRRIMMLRR
jgi:hypothetical protein